MQTKLSTSHPRKYCVILFAWPLVASRPSYWAAGYILAGDLNNEVWMASLSTGSKSKQERASAKLKLVSIVMPSTRTGEPRLTSSENQHFSLVVETVFASRLGVVLVNVSAHAVSPRTA